MLPAVQSLRGTCSEVACWERAGTEPGVVGVCAEGSQAGSPSHSGGNGRFGGGWWIGSPC
jgi:hypothetical protein